MYSYSDKSENQGVASQYKELCEVAASACLLILCC